MLGDGGERLGERPGLKRRVWEVEEDDCLEATSTIAC